MNTRKLRNAWYYFERFVRREINYYLVRPTNLLLFLTYRCTSQCRSCTMWQRKVERPEMSLEQWKGFMMMMREYPIGNVEMFGGDALLRKDVLFPLTRFIKAQGIPQVDLVTNCNLMDAETAREIVDSGIDTVYMSLDGVDDEHDRARGADAGRDDGHLQDHGRFSRGRSEPERGPGPDGLLAVSIEVVLRSRSSEWLHPSRTFH
jgi:MoaA/NifB/PqqE/SkfB family radical SAM enzyme